MKFIRHLVLFLTIALTMRLGAQQAWTTVASPTTQTLWGICYGGGQFVAVGEAGTILTSTDGLAWTQQISGTNVWLTSVTYFDGSFIAVGDKGSTLRSFDGINWMPSNRPGGDPAQRLNVVRPVRRSLLIMGEDDSLFLGTDYISTDANYSFNWGVFTYTIARTKGRWWRGIAFNNETVVAVGRDGVSALSDGNYYNLYQSQYICSPSGVANMEGVAFGRNRFVAVGQGGVMCISQTGASWAKLSAVTNEALNDIIFVDNNFVAIGTRGTVISSVDGYTWKSSTPVTSRNLCAVTGVKDLMIAVGAEGVIIRGQSIPTAPAFLSQPVDVSETAGGVVYFQASCSGSLPISYQWYRNGIPLVGATDSALLLDHITSDMNGAYAVAAVNSAGTVTSSSALLTVQAAPVQIVDPTFKADASITESPNLVQALPDGGVLVVMGGNQMKRLRADGSLDTSFQTVTAVGRSTGTVSPIQIIKLLSDGKILIGGNIASLNGIPCNNLARINADGSLDTSFVSAQEVAGGMVSDLAIQPDGGILVANNTSRLIRLHSNGKLDTGFSPPPLTWSNVNFAPTVLSIDRVTLSSGGKIYICGSLRTIDSAGFVTNSYSADVWRLNMDGSIDDSFRITGIEYNVKQLIAVSGEKLLVAGVRFEGPFYRGYGTNKFHIQRYKSNGVADGDYTPFDSSIISFLSDLAFNVLWLSSDMLMVSDGASICRLKADGTIDNAFTPGFLVSTLPRGIFQAPFSKSWVTIYPGGSVFAYGDFTVYNGVECNHIVRLNNVTKEATNAPGDARIFADTDNVKRGDEVEFKVLFKGSGSLTYVWNSSIITTTPYLKTKLPLSVNYVRIINTKGESYSSKIILDLPPSDPIILEQTTEVKAQKGRDATLSIKVSLYDSSCGYQWFHNGNRISNIAVSGAMLTLTNITAQDAGDYAVKVMNVAGVTTTSAPIHVEVVDQSRLRAIATRGFMGGGESVIIAGFIIDGEVAKHVIIRGLGPDLATRLGMKGVLDDPKLTLYSSGNVYVDSNDNWNQYSLQDGDLETAGLMPLEQDSKDAMLVCNLSPGHYTAVLSSATPNGAGIGLVEVYEADNRNERLTALSTRAFVGVNDAVCIPGISVDGSYPKKILVRAVGPSLAAQGVTAPLAHPVLKLVNPVTGEIVASNDNWSISPQKAEIITAAASVGLTPLSDPSLDAALLVTVPPGNYSALVSGANNTSGVAMVEVYEVQ